MKELPAILARGERARLFPVLADTSKEGRTLSIFLACFQNVDEFSRSLLSTLGVRAGSRARIETFTEVELRKANGASKHRPDGLIQITTGSKVWSALVEAKVGNNELYSEQIEAYLELAKLNGVDALITLSNQFAPLPSHHPVAISGIARKKAQLFHWSWMHVVTEAALLVSNGDVSDRDQQIILQEMNRFLLDASSGVKGFEQMPAAWTDMVGKVQAGGKILANAEDTKEVIGAWHQEVGDLSLVLSRLLETEVQVQMSRAQAADPALRQKEAQTSLASDNRLETTLLIPDAAAPVEVSADLRSRSISASMWLRAPDDKKTTKARLNWLMGQLQKSEANGVHIRMNWPGKTAATQHSLKTLRDTPEVADRPGSTVTSFRVLLVKDMGGRFAQRKNFISDLEAMVSDFYKQVGVNLRAWQAKAPKLKAEPDAVTPEALREEAEQDALGREG